MQLARDTVNTVQLAAHEETLESSQSWSRPQGCSFRPPGGGTPPNKFGLSDEHSSICGRAEQVSDRDRFLPVLIWKQLGPWWDIHEPVLTKDLFRSEPLQRVWMCWDGNRFLWSWISLSNLEDSRGAGSVPVRPGPASCPLVWNHRKVWLSLNLWGKSDDEKFPEGPGGFCRPLHEVEGFCWVGVGSVEPRVLFLLVWKCLSSNSLQMKWLETWRRSNTSVLLSFSSCLNSTVCVTLCCKLCICVF